MKKAILMLVAVIGLCVLLTGCGNSNIEKSAKPLVTQILKNQLVGPNAAKCEKVTITEKVSDNFYKAKAVLSNGNEIKITIKVNEEKGNIYVSIPNTQ